MDSFTRSFSFFAIVLVVIAVFCAKGTYAEETPWEFNYKDISAWTGHFAACAGKHQSPVNIDTSPGKIIPKKNVYPKFLISGFDKKPNAINVTNNDHSAVATFPDGMTVSGGPVGKAVFKFVQLHFHWGSKDEVGSEHRVDNKSFPIECHFVHYNTKYGSLDVAQEKSDGLMVIAVWGQLSKTANTALQPIAKSLQRVRMGPTATRVEDDHLEPMQDLLPKNLNVYYYYNGSLTTPSCSETVTWILFKTTIQISEEQLNAFRLLARKSDESYLSDNFRPLQPLDERTIEFVTSAAAENRIAIAYLFGILLFGLSGFW